MPLILSGNVATAIGGAYEVANSCRFNRADSPKHEKSLGTSTNDKKHTFSCWFKKCENSVSSSEHGLMNSTTDGNNFVNCMFHSTDTFQYYAKIGGSEAMFLRPNAVFRDNSAWSNIVIGVDTSQAVAANRVKMYINGTQVTSWNTETYPDQNAVLDTNESGAAIQIGCMKGPAHYFHGYMAEVVFIDGTQYAASDFGEFDSDSPQIWKPKDVSGLTFGTNGFYLDFEDSSNLGNDVNGGTDLTETNLAATDQSTDTCTNNFCTINSLDNYHAGNTLSEGNLKIVSAGGGAGWDGSNTGTMGVSAGKWYWELFADTDANVEIYGIKSGVSHTDSNYVTETTALGELGYGIVTTSGNMGYPDGQSESYGSAIDADDKLMFALDMDNLRFYFGVNGTWANSGDPAGNSNGYTISAPPSGFYFPAVSFYVSETIYLNFGSPPTGFTIVSGNADDNGYGDFEYDVPAGFYAICSKNLGEFGG